MFVGLISKLEAGDEQVLGLTNAIDFLLPLGAGLYFVGFLVSGIAFLAWFYAAHKNLSLAGLQPSYASGWTIGGFFVPFLNLVRPYQLMKELWRGSEYLVDATDEGDWQEREADSIVWHWWALLIIAGIAGRFASKMGSDSNALSDMVAEAYMMLISDLIDVVGVIVAVLLVKKITGFQEQARQQWDVPDVEPGANPEVGGLGTEGVAPIGEPR